MLKNISDVWYHSLKENISPTIWGPLIYQCDVKYQWCFLTFFFYLTSKLWGWIISCSHLGASEWPSLPLYLSSVPSKSMAMAWRWRCSDSRGRIEVDRGKQSSRRRIGAGSGNGAPIGDPSRSWRMELVQEKRDQGRSRLVWEIGARGRERARLGDGAGRSGWRSSNKFTLVFKLWKKSIRAQII